MRRLKIAILVITSVALLAVFGVEVFAATYLSLNIGGRIEYISTEIGAEIWALMH